jgi:hypothetical protein
MAQLAVLIAGLLLIADSQASDVVEADPSTVQGFLSNKFIVPAVSNVQHGSGPDALSRHNNPAEQSPKMANYEEEKAAQKLVANNSNMSITLSAIGVGFLALVTMFGARIRRGLQPGSGDNIMEMQSQDSGINNPRRVGWGQLSSENSRQQTLCYGRKDWSYPANELSMAKSAAMPFLPCPPALDGTLPGDRGFDPLGFTNLDWNMAEVIIPKAATMAGDTELPMIYWLREAELKHGRITMLAIVGYLTVDAGIHFPGAKYEGIDALHAHDAMTATGNMGVMLLFAAVAELTSMTAVIGATKGSGREAGDFSLDPLEFCGNPETKAFMKEAEITHARLAMLAFSGLVTQSALLEKGFPYF